ncbi:MAG TPA: beta-ketoacyl reductase, partial [Labilithrix sp.]|nr:beta-ketoacyl reductase [Labilithrix sp.]
SAFEHLARARHIGKVVVTAEETVTVRDPARSDQIEPDKTYLITGGLGGLGLVVAKRLAKLGAKHLALMGRSAPSSSAKEAIRELEASGVQVHVVRADVGERRAVASALEELARSSPPLGGVVHAAGVVDDATLSNLTADRIGPVLAPKVRGTHAVDRLLPGLGLRVYFSSASAVLGSGGQAHYAAANAYLDAWAHHQRGRSQHAISVDWGAWGEAGLVATSERIDNVGRQGLAMLANAEGAELFERLLPSSKAQVVALPVDFRQWRQANPQLSGMPLLREVLASSSPRPSEANTGLFQRLQAAVSEPERIGILEDYFRTAIAAVLRSSPDLIQRTAPMKQLGFDSLMTVSLKNTLERDLAIPVSTATLFAHPTVEKLALYAAHKLAPSSRTTVGEERSLPAAVATAQSSKTPDVPPSTATPSLDDVLARLGKRGYL